MREGFLATREQPGAPKKHEVTFVERVRRSALAKLRKSPLYFTVNHYLKPLKAWMQSNRDGSGIDWSRTRVSSRGQWGHLYINLKGRDPHGIVDPADYDRVCAEVARQAHRARSTRSAASPRSTRCGGGTSCITAPASSSRPI